jgi:hypothetical protein
MFAFLKDLFDLHKSVQTQRVVDAYKPVGAWKTEPNSTVNIGGELLPEPEKLDRFRRFCAESWSESIKLVDNARQKQPARKTGRMKRSVP